MYLFSSIGIPVSFWYVYKRKKKLGKSINKKHMRNKKSNKIPLKEKFGLVIGITVFLFSSISSVYFVQDLPYVFLHHPIKYEGKCETDITLGSHGDLEIKFGKHSISFVTHDYYKVQNGTYYCKLDYLPHTESGISLLLYKSKGRKEVKME